MRAYREWRVYLLAEDLRPVLVSAYMDTVWLGPELVADREPEIVMEGLGDLHGVHAATADYPRGHDSHYLATIGATHASSTPYAVGAVELSGTIVEHADGVLRASAARVLALRLVMLPDRCPERCDRWIGIPYGGILGRNGPPPHRPLLNVMPACLPSCHMPDAVYLEDQPVLLEGEYVSPLPPNAWHPTVSQWQKSCAEAPGPRRRPPYTGAELERLLLERYEVPRLPDGEGPWRRPTTTTEG